MQVLIENWYLIVAAACMGAAICLAVDSFVGLPREEQLSKVREWLLLAVTEAEAQFGGGTGAIKLRYVYDLFVARFSWLVKVVSFDTFAGLVDDALAEMEGLLATNKAVKAIVKGESE